MSLHIVLFDDDPKYGRRVLVALNQALAGKGKATLFMPTGKVDQSVTYQARIERELSLPQYKDSALIVADYDLSATASYRGLSEQQVRAAAASLAVPECAYARGSASSRGAFIRLSKQQEASVLLDFRPGQETTLARDALSVAEGFVQIGERLPQALRKLKRTSPGALMAEILGKPEYADKIALYASGDQDRLASMTKQGATRNEFRRRLVCAFGYWLWDSILRYPGVVVDQVAAASYLNISATDFGKTEVQQLFSTALYRGPFAGTITYGQFWWRGKLDDIVSDSRLPDGRQFAAKRLGRPVRRSEGSVGSAETAGFVCMITGKPVSMKNSRGGLPWFPRGADLARVSAKALEEIGPWL
jgi:hypothetical protein